MRLNLALTVLAAIGVVNGFRLYPALPARHRWQVLVGSGIALATAAALAASADGVLDWLDVSAESLRITAGAVLLISAARTLVWPQAKAEPESTSRWAALVPVAFPLLVTPELAVFALSVGADRGIGRVVAALAVGLGLAVLVSLIPRRPISDSLTAWAARLAGLALAVAAVALVVDGIRDV